MKLLFIYSILFLFPFPFTFSSICISRMIFKGSVGSEIPGVFIGIISFILFWAIAMGIGAYQLISRII